MAEMTTGTFGKAIYPNPFTDWVGLAYGRYPDLVPQCFEMRTSDQSVEEITSLADMGNMIVTPEMGMTPYDAMQQLRTKQVTFANYRLGFVVSRNLIEDGKGINIVQEGASQIGKAYRETRNIVAYSVMNNAFNGVETSVDGATLISTSHPTLAGTTSNRLSTNAGFSEASLEQCAIEVKDTRSERGHRLPTYFTKLVIPRELSFDVSRVINNDLRPGTADRDINASTYANVVPDCVVIDYLDDPDAYFFLTNHDKCLMFYDRLPLETSRDNVFDNDNLKFKGYARFAATCRDHRGIFGSQGV